jgi:hypothetical protein
MEEIGEKEGISKMEVSRVCNEMADLPKSYKPHADHLIDFEIPLYNVWKFKGVAISPILKRHVLQWRCYPGWRRRQRRVKRN